MIFLSSVCVKSKEFVFNSSQLISENPIHALQGTEDVTLAEQDMKGYMFRIKVTYIEKNEPFSIPRITNEIFISCTSAAHFLDFIITL